MTASTTIHPTSEAEATDLTHILGDELRQVRRDRRWSRKELRARLEHHVSLPALASYELGIRQCSVNRFVEICEALETAAPELLAHALRRLTSATHIDGLHVDLRPVINDNSRKLCVFRRWAQQRLATTPSTDTGVRLAAPAVERLAELCGVTTPDLIATLATLGAIQEGCGFTPLTPRPGSPVTPPTTSPSAAMSWPRVMRCRRTFRRPTGTAVFPDPDSLDLTRPTTGHLTFGHGAHYCVGAKLARMELRVALGELVRRLPGLRLAIDADEVSWNPASSYEDRSRSPSPDDRLWGFGWLGNVEVPAMISLLHQHI